MCNTDIESEAKKIRREKQNHEIEIEYKLSQIDVLTQEIYYLRKLIKLNERSEKSLKNLKLRK